MIDIYLLSSQCAPDMPTQTLAAITKVESNHNPYAIGIVNGYLVRQPKNKEEAIATALMLYQKGFNFSMGIGQININNMQKYNLSFEKIFEPCDNLHATSKIFVECYQRALENFQSEREAMLASYSCYYSGNFTRGFKAEGENNISYVDKVVKAELSFPLEQFKNIQTIPVISTQSTVGRIRGTSAPISKNILDRNQDAKMYKHQLSKKKVNEMRGD